MSRPARLLGAAVATLALANVTRSTLVPGRWHLAFNLATGAAMVGIGVAGGLDRDRLGLARARLGAGLRLGSLAFAGISAAVVTGGLLGIVTDDRADVGAAAMLAKVLVVIPFGTVLVEELAFRGVVHGALHELTDRRRVIAVGAVLFGLWHVFPAWRGGAVDVEGLGRLGTVVGTFAATALAGVGLIWLRERSGSLVAPMLAHLATNSVAFAVAWAAT